MSNTVKLLVILGLSYVLVHWAITNPASAESIVEKVDSAITTSVDFISETLFDSEKKGE
ncbi:MAG: hypothetical protein MK009_05890 [Gammaproteobacteria bacterium]|nr:hypothetical protein [Gammaproteobacteria bacterium]